MKRLDYHAVKKYIGETGRTFTTQTNEHKRRNVKKRNTCSKGERAISNHCKKENHNMDTKHHWWIREAIEIWKQAQRTINRDEGADILTHTWDAVLKRRQTGGGAITG